MRRKKMNLVKVRTKSIIKVLTMAILLTFLLSGVIPSFAMQDDPPEGQINERIIRAPEEDQTLFVFRSSDIVGSAVQNLQGEQLGNIENLIVDIESGQILFGVLSCCGFLGLGEDLYAIPWELIYPQTGPGYLYPGCKC
jgi:sporulation protein YlmC with PRC-barrel domain